jgi:hypothetical protein
MLHFKASGRYLPARSPAAAWGDFVEYIEVAEDQFATRQVDAFENGNFLIYDRSHGRDAFGYLTGVRFSRKPKWRRFYPDAVIIPSSEFEAIWRRALRLSMTNQASARQTVE